MDWTVGTFGTVGNDALDAGDCLRTSWTLGSAAGAKTWILNDGGFRPEPDVVFGPNQTWFSARTGQSKSPDRPSSARRAAPCVTPGEAPGGRRNPGYDSNIELRPEGATLARHAASHRASERHVVHPVSMGEALQNCVMHKKTPRGASHGNPGQR